MKYKNGDKVKIVKYNKMFRGQSLYLNMTGKVIGKVGELNKLRLDYESKKEIDDFLLDFLGYVYVLDEQLIKIEKGLEIE